MKTKEYITVDKSTWADGPWQTEPDKVQYEDWETKLPCLIVRNAFGALCGYVGVSEGHPAYKKEYYDLDYEVHGGLTFSDFCLENPTEESGICHVPEEEEPEKVWWLGFGCGHCYDAMPHPDWEAFRDGSYRDISYVRNQIGHLAQQVKEKANEA